MLETPQQNRSLGIAGGHVFAAGRKASDIDTAQGSRVGGPVGERSAGRKVVLGKVSGDHFTATTRTSFRASFLAALAETKSSPAGWNAMVVIGVVRCSSDLNGSTALSPPAANPAEL